MSVTGFMIWFPVTITQFLPRWAVEVATTIHYYEAILACLAVLVWHSYHVIFDPAVYPLNWAFLDGKVSERFHAERHEEAGPANEPAPTATVAQRQNPHAEST